MYQNGTTTASATYGVVNGRTSTFEMVRAFADALRARDSGDLRSFFDGIRRVHALNAAAIERGVYDPCLVEWSLVFTPIERELWIDIRERNLPMFPQYPVRKFFADFANPWTKIVIECDGKHWHNAARDSRRDDQMYDDGWRVWRLSGRAIWSEVDADDPRESMRDDVLARAAYDNRWSSWGSHV